MRVGVAVDVPLRAWTARSAALLAAADGVEEVVVLPLVTQPVATAAALHARLDRRLSRHVGTALEQARPEAAGTACVDAPIERRRVRERVRELRLDLVVDLGSGTGDGFGVETWQLLHGGVPAGAQHALVRELLAGERVCLSALVRRSASDEQVLYATRSLVRRISLARTRDPILWKGAELPRRALDLRLRARRQPGPPAVGVPALTAAPRARDIALLEARLARRALAYTVEKLLKRWTWSIDWAECGEPATDPSRFRPRGSLSAPRGHFFADPFVVGDGDRHYVFYEDYSRPERRATISVAVVEHGTAGDPGREIVRAPHHLSYPFVFHDGEHHYLLPESAEAEVVQLFRAVEFPYRWEPDTTLLAGLRGYDPTLLAHDGCWFLFVAVPALGADVDELHVYWSDDLRGPYLPHPLNPVVSDASRARPAGRIFRLRGRIVRPGQDGVGGYGAAVVLSEIRTLTPDDYDERLLSRIAPDWDKRAWGTHTIDHDAGMQVMDVKRLARRWA